MEDDEYPNYGDAFPARDTTSTNEEQSSWNPALRPNTVEDKPLTVKSAAHPPASVPAASEEPIQPIQQSDGGVELGTEVDADITDHAQDEAPAQIVIEDDVLEQDEEAGANYEHQGDITELEEAIDESAAAPLIQDEQPLPTVATLSREASLALDEDLKPVTNDSRSFTTNFTEIPEADNAVQPATNLPSDWPAVGDDKTFEDLLGDSQVTDASEPVAEDMSAVWAAALDDDDILEESNELDPSTIFGDDDDDGFLVDELAIPAAPLQQRSVSAYVPGTAKAAPLPPPFAAPSSPFIDQSHARGPATTSSGLYDVYGQGNVMPAQAVQTRPGLPSAQSFADKPQSGYSSPYDLPMEVVKTRRRPAATPAAPNAAVAPPRTSSFGAASMSDIYAAPSPPNSSHGPASGPQAPGTAPAKTSSADPAFFEDLPITTKPRARVSGAYTPQLGGLPTPPLGAGPPQFPQHPGPPMQAQPARPSSAYAPQAGQQPHASVPGGLRQPEQAPLFPEHAAPIGQAPTGPSQASNRYSPAPQAVPSAARYSPAAPAQPAKTGQRYASSPSAIPSLPPSRSGQSFVPRTSSPLAVHGRPQPQPELSAEQLRSLSGGLPGSPGKSFEYGDRRGSATSRYAPSVPSIPSDSPIVETNAFSPRRQRTQSPSEFRKIAPLTQTTVPSLLTGSANEHSAPMRLTHKRQFSRELAFAAPNDERAHDPLQRWKGHAIYQSHPSGAMLSSIPKQTPFYGAGSSLPSVKCTSGDVKLLDAGAVLAIEECDARYPGPLTARAKGKKKDVLNWMTLKVSALQQYHDALKLDFSLSDRDRRAAEEKLLLWQVMRLYVEHDGVLEGSPKLETEVRQLMIPDLEQKSQIVDLQSPTAGVVAGDVTDTSTLYQIRQALFEGQRERAVLIAEDKKLWGHAMLIASTMGPEQFKQIVGSFVRSQVKSQSSSELKSLSALYQVFAGSPEDCVDELVPPSARAGFQMISTADGRGSVVSLAGLDQWRDTLSLMHSNPTPGNAASLLAIGKLLAGYGRFEAAHVCYLFARSLAKHSGADDADAHFVLLGADAANGHVDLDSLMLTEVYEYASSLSAPSTAVHYIPHLQSYKLLHAQYLAAAGHKTQAQSYCEHIDAAIRSTTRPSGYFHQAFAQELLAFNALLSQSPQTGGSTGKFFSRPAMDKVSSGMGSWFTKFVSGDEGETDSNASGPNTAEGDSYGPFSGVNGSTGPISRTTSSVDLQNQAAFNPVPLMQPFQAAQSIPNRYTPVSHGNTSKYAPAYPASHASFDSAPSSFTPGPAAMPMESVRSTSGRYAPAATLDSPALLAVHPPAISRRASNQSLASTGSYEPRPVLAEHDGYAYTPPIFEADPVVPAVTLDAPVSNGLSLDAPTAETPELGDYASPTMGYEPPSMGYEAPTFQPYEPEAEVEEDSAPKPKKKSFMDDDFDDEYAPSAPAQAPKAQVQESATSPSSSRDPDPAIVAAAAADAAREASKGHSSRESGSWFGGWFGKKDPNAAPGPIKAKLGEQSSFYFDKDLNKWVNGKAGAEAAPAAAATPPPPRAVGTPVGGLSGPPSRAASGGPPMLGSAPPSRQGTPSNVPGMPPKTALSPTGGPAQGLMAPPARPASSVGDANSIDDLLAGPPGGKKAAGAKGKKKGRYVDIMANAG